jgi:hypothetical protein
VVASVREPAEPFSDPDADTSDDFAEAPFIEARGTLAVSESASAPGSDAVLEVVLRARPPPVEPFALVTTSPTSTPAARRIRSMMSAFLLLEVV